MASTQPLASRSITFDRTSGTLTTREFEVRVVSSGAEARPLRIRAPVRVGSHPGAELRLDDPTVSRFHLELSPSADGLTVRDLGSRNGSFVRGLRISEVVVEGLTTVELGKTVLELRPVDEVLETTPLHTFGEAIAQSASMRALFGVLARVAPSDATVLLEGETGTGKELLARGLHQASPRRSGPFRTVDCGALAPELVESELFGHVRGAFTGAIEDRAGALELASGGTLFLDRVDELPLELQAKLLRPIEARTVTRVGATATRALDVRWVASARSSLEEKVAQQAFRADLFYRLSPVTLRVPPLRERLEDLGPLIAEFLRRLGRPDFQISPSLLARMKEHRWPGNVRELENVIERALLGTAADPLPQERALPSAPGKPFADAKEEVVAEFARAYFGALIERHRGNLAQVAKEAGIPRTYLYKVLERYGLRTPS